MSIPTKVITFFQSKNVDASIRNMLKFKSGGWQKDNRQWGLIWTLEKYAAKPKLSHCKIVDVVTKTGEKVKAYKC